MSTQVIHLDLPSDILLTLNESEGQLKERIRTSLAVQLYSQQKVTIGKAAQIADMSRFRFETFLSENKIPISSLEINEILADIEKLKLL